MITFGRLFPLHSLHLLHILWKLDSCPLSVFFFSCPWIPPITARPIKNCSWKGSNYSFVSHTWFLPASTNDSLWFPTVRCLTKHSSKPPHAPAGLATSFSLRQSVLMRSRLHFMAIWGPMANREMPDNEWIIKGWPVARKDFLISLPPPTQHSIFFLMFPSVSSSDGPWMLHANERRCCGFNANQRRANIHLVRWLHVERKAVPTWNASFMFSSPGGPRNPATPIIIILMRWLSLTLFWAVIRVDSKHHFLYWTGCI